MSETPPAPTPDRTATQQLLAQVGAAVQANDLPRAFILARGGLDSGIEHPGLLSLRALWFEQQGEFEEALIDLDRAQELAPDDFSILNAKGLLYDKLRRPQDAIAAFEAAVRLQPRFAPAHHNLGWAREAVGDEAGARLGYEQALALKPDYPEPSAHLARLAARRGDAATARMHAERTLRIDPRQPTAINALAEAELSEGQVDQAEARLRDLLAQEPVTPFDRGVAGSLLGDALDRQGRFAEAFAAYAAGNQELKTLYAPRFATARGQSVSQMLAWLVSYMAGVDASAWKRRPEPATPADPDAPAVHVFMVGFPRSGSTFLEKILSSSPAAVMLADQDALGDAVRDFMADAGDLDHLSRLGGAELEPYRRAYWRRVQESGVTVAGKMFIDKLPLNAARIPLILKLFPTAKIVFSLRDPRDVVLSCFRRRVQMNAVAYEFLTLEGAALVYDLMMRLTLLYREKLPIPLGLVRYEDLVENPEVQVRSVCDYLGVEMTPEMRGFAALESARFANADPQNQGYYGDIVGAWRNYAAELEAVQDILKPWVGQFGYPLD
jgi:Tfp pilus assembly protein PilF